METLDGTEWDVVIVGTGLAKSLLALSLSRSGKRILHLDANDYYGGEEAAFSLDEARGWAAKHAAVDASSTHSHATITSSKQDGPTSSENRPRLASSRAYSLTLSPQLVYSRSDLVSTVVSSQIHNQLDFQAVGSWFVLHPRPPAFSITRLSRVPSGREDVFSDTALDLRAKRSLMKFLRFVGNYEEQGDVWEAEKETPFPTFLEQKFALPPSSHTPILALTLSGKPGSNTSTAVALPRIARHLRSLGVFGPGFGAVLPKWGGLAEVVQVACRACAVGGGVYVLNKGIQSVEKKRRDQEPSIQLQLDGGEKVSTRWLVGLDEDLRTVIQGHSARASETATTSRSISIVSSPLASLFPRTSEGGPIPAGAVISVPSANADEPPVFVLAHTSEAGECPMNQSVLYASVALPAEQGHERLRQAVNALLDNVTERDPAEGQVKPEVLWEMHYQQTTPVSGDVVIADDGVITLPAMAQDLVFDDGVLGSVKQAWQSITGESLDTFMQFDAREGVGDDELND